MTKRQVEDPVGRQRLAFELGTNDDGTETVLVECWVDPGGGVPPHIHPHQTEVFEVVEGEMTFTAGRTKQVARAGETVTVPPGTRHAYENRSASSAYMRCVATPAAGLQDFLETTAQLSRQGHIMRIGPLRGPGSLRGLPKLAAMLERHRENTVILMPPPLVQRLVLFPLARFADRSRRG
ncbi:MAG TPA: cupin domain-containing protein [Thermoleophilaceae bacterium]|jgi:quercetin dioxygenase-like cupin family protein